jgi:sugar phosphate permease
VNEFGWLNVMWASATLTMLIAIVTWLAVRDDPTDRHNRSYAANRDTHHASPA